MELPVPESENERLGRRIQVKAPDLERENPRRNDAVLSAIAKNRAEILRGNEFRASTARNAPLVEELKDQTTTVIMPITQTPTRGGLAAVDDDCAVRAALFGVADTTALETSVR